MTTVNKLLTAIGMLTLLAAIFGSTTLYFAGTWMQVHDVPAQADYIIPLAGDKHRFIHAADLYKQGFAPTILISIPYDEPLTRLTEIKQEIGYPQYSHREYARRFFQVLNVPEDTLSFYGNGVLSTIEEAEALRDHLGPGAHRLLLVTSPYHARRAKMIYKHALPQATIMMTVTPYEPFEEKWWADYHTAPKVVVEAAKCAFYLLGGAFRSTD